MLTLALTAYVSMFAAPVTDLIRSWSSPGSIVVVVVGDPGLVVTIILVLGLESVVIVIFGAVVGRVTVLSAFATDSFVLLSRPGHKSLIFLQRVNLFGEALKSGVQNSSRVFHF